MTASGLSWRARVIFILSAAVATWFGPAALIGFVADEGWRAPNAEHYEVVTRSGGAAGPIVARRAATWWDVTFNFVVAPVLVILVFVSLSGLGAFHSYRWMLRYEPRPTVTPSFAKLTLIVVSILGLWNVSRIASVYKPSMLAWLAWLGGMTLAALLFLFVYRKVRHLLNGQTLRSAA